ESTARHPARQSAAPQGPWDSEPQAQYDRRSIVHDQSPYSYQTDRQAARVVDGVRQGKRHVDGARRRRLLRQNEDLFRVTPQPARLDPFPMSTFFVASEAIVPPTVRITGPLLHHLRESLRLQPGEILSVIDDRGTRYRTEITEVTSRAVVGR